MDIKWLVLPEWGYQFIKRRDRMDVRSKKFILNQIEGLYKKLEKEPYESNLQEDINALKQAYEVFDREIKPRCLEWDR